MEKSEPLNITVPANIIEAARLVEVWMRQNGVSILAGVALRQTVEKPR